MIEFPSADGRSAFERGQAPMALLPRRPVGRGPTPAQQHDGIGTGRSAGSEDADVYPGHTAFLALLNQLAGGVRGNRIGHYALSKDALALRLAAQFFGASVAPQTNAEWMTLSGQPLGFDEPALAKAVEAALGNAQGFAEGSRWSAWSGTHMGQFYVGQRVFIDVAVWQPPRGESTQLPADVNQSPPDEGLPRQYALQPVSWWSLSSAAAAKLKRTGWNQSHREVPYIWGWDPKNQGDQQGKVGAHYGFPFTLGSCDWIVWVCFGEVFLECVQLEQTRTVTIAGRQTTGRPKSSTRDVPGWGQWLIEDTTRTPPVW